VTQTSQGAPAAVSGSRHLRNYTLLLSGFVVSSAGDWLYRLALPLLVLKLTGSALQAAVIYSLEYIPYLVFAPIGGAIADRFDRRRLLIRSDLAAAGIASLLATLVWIHEYHLWLIYLVAFALSLLTPLYQATFLAMVPAVVPREQLAWANSRLQTGQSVLDLAGPLIGASVVAVLGINRALALDAVSFALSACAMALMKNAARRAIGDTQASIAAELKEAVRFVRSSPPLLWGSFLSAGCSLGLVMVESNMLAYLIHIRHLPVAVTGIVFAALGGGAVAGALMAPRILRRTPPGRLIITCTLIGGIATALLIVLQPVPAIAAVWVIVGASTGVFTVTFFTLRHQLAPEHMIGRVVIITRLIGFSVLPVAPVIGGAVFSSTGTFWPVLLISAAIQIGAAAWATLTPLRKVREPG
jgi:MFS family permease